MRQPKIKNLLLTPRFTVSLVFGLLVVGFLLDTSWSWVSSPRKQYQRMQTQSALLIVRDEINTYRKRTGRLPKTLNEIGSLPHKRLGTQGQSDFLDGWGHPVIYERIGESFRVVSLGRDGRADGAGLDYDVSSDTPFRLNTWWPLAGRLTLIQFISSYPFHVAVPCFAGLFVSLMGWIVLNPKYFKTAPVTWYWLASLMCTAIISIVVALLVAMLLTATH